MSQGSKRSHKLKDLPTDSVIGAFVSASEPVSPSRGSILKGGGMNDSSATN